MAETIVVTKEDFRSYVEVQSEGLYNMLDPRARELTGLSREKYTYIIGHYSELEDMYDIHCE